MNYNKICPVCDVKFTPHDMIQCFDYTLYHNDCIDLYPIKYFAMIDDEPLGETEYDSGEDAYDYIEFADEEWNNE